LGLLDISLPSEPLCRVRCPDIAKARKLLGWAPTVSLEEGLKQTIEYFRRDLSG
jgi:nucleoside-diphosphate-sugar epimerase